MRYVVVVRVIESRERKSLQIQSPGRNTAVMVLLIKSPYYGYTVNNRS
jgi:hypothetical protein